jgi:hypothetical protein
MILLVHMLFGVAIASLVKNPYLAILLAFLSHYFLDFFPHVEYPINNLKNLKNLLSLKKRDRAFLVMNTKKILPEFLSVVFDFLLGLFFVFILTNKSLIIFLCAIVSIVPDGLSVVSVFFPNKILKMHDTFHRKKAHFLKHMPISNFWRILSQILTGVISIIILR